MQSFLLTVDRFSTWIGKTFAWSVVLLSLLIGWEVFMRYVLNNPHAWVLDAQIMLYGTLFMTAGAYTLSKNGHVRDVEASGMAACCIDTCYILLRHLFRDCNS